jgi:tRNA A-37 threonylcarbamoyl transferase component Bud32
VQLTPGTRIGPYEILAPLGAGGMGEVYKARDSKLDRIAAIKVLPDTLSRDPERLARFEREAKTLAAIDHPNVARVYGVEDSGGVGALAMEYVDGSPIRGPVPLDTALDYARQIADALEATHDKGIVHRDLKPANILVTPDGRIKVLDFGLATPADTRVSAEVDHGFTRTMGLTQAGVVMGTAAYMSPEQARGKLVDRRTDIWAFGAVLAELITGKPLFEGETASDVVVKVLGPEPDLTSLPSRVQYVVARCLRADPRKRWQAIGDARLALDEEPQLAAANTVPSSRGAYRLPWIVAGVMFLAAAAASIYGWRTGRRETAPLMVRVETDTLAPDLPLHQEVAYASVSVRISPDGTRLIYPVRDAKGRQMLAMRPINESKATLIEGTEGGFDPFFSPDGQSIGFFADSKLKRVGISGGLAVTLAEATNPRGATWGEDGTIVAALTNNDGLSRIVAGSKPQPFTRLKQGEATHRWPQFLPGGRSILFTNADNLSNYEGATIEIAELKTGERRIVQNGGYFGRYAESGHLLYIRGGALFAAGMRPSGERTPGDPVQILSDVASSANSAAGRFDVSRTGVLVYDSGKTAVEIWGIAGFDAAGKRKPQPQLSAPGAYTSLRFSPEGQRLAVSLETKGVDTYVYDMRRDLLTRLTFTGKEAMLAVWAPDGQHLTYQELGGERNVLAWMRADGAGSPVKLADGNGLVAYSFTGDGRQLAYHQRDGQGFRIFVLPLDLSDPDHPQAGNPIPFSKPGANEMHPRISQDQRWIAYDSNESGTYEVYVQPFRPAGGEGKWQVSFGGGIYPIWSRDGRTLFFVRPDNHIMAASYGVTGNSFVSSKPQLWSQQQLVAPIGEPNYDVSPDGTYVEALVPPNGDGKTTSHTTFLVNFFDELRRRVPGTRLP